MQDEIEQGTGVTTRRMSTESKLKMLEFDSMVNPEGTCNQKELLGTRVTEPTTMERGQVQEGLIQPSRTAEQVPKCIAHQIVR